MLCSYFEIVKIAQSVDVHIFIQCFNIMTRYAAYILFLATVNLSIKHMVVRAAPLKKLLITHVLVPEVRSQLILGDTFVVISNDKHPPPLISFVSFYTIIIHRGMEMFHCSWFISETII